MDTVIFYVREVCWVLWQLRWFRILCAWLLVHGLLVRSLMRFTPICLGLAAVYTAQQEHAIAAELREMHRRAWS